ncbi:MAG TPA: PfkB family carbohydrate kinase [Spirochaetia bacterium]|nr:PfkB family carbohydrate kinase [Spirochaetia bacterium]
MTGNELEVLLGDIRRARIGVIGDYCLDAYWYLDPSLSEISIETGLATRAVSRQSYSLGGAGNVANNLVAMGVGRVCAFGVLGDDAFGREMRRIMRAAGIEARGVVFQDHDWSTPVYVKPIENGNEQGRIDFGGANALDPAVGRSLLDALQAELPGLDLVIINQQLPHGIHTEWLRALLGSLIASSSTRFIVDSRAFSDSFGSAIRKLNDHEALRLCGVSWKEDAPVTREVAAAAASTLFSRWSAPVFITRGARGIIGQDEAGTFEVPGLQIIGRIDTVGAGDSALAGIAAALASGRGCLEAATLGNFVAGVTVRKLYITGTASPEEILAVGSDPDYVFRPELAEDPRAACYYGGKEIEIVSGLRSGRAVKTVIFDFDGTVSTLREGWEEIMQPVMIRSILGDGWVDAPADIYQDVKERVRGYIDATTGVQTLVQMQGLAAMVKELGLVPASQVKDAWGYKEDYDRELQAKVDARIARIQAGELSCEDYMIKGAREVLEALEHAGVRLFLASGTDEDDVLREARVLGVDRFFDDRVLGAVGNPNIEAKKVVLERIAGLVGQQGLAELVTFGDGPVEVRETKKRGGYAIGVATDEPRRYGLNVSKRSRLVRAGADLVIPDFLPWKKVLELLGVHV